MVLFFLFCPEITKQKNRIKLILHLIKYPFRRKFTSSLKQNS